MRQVTLMNVLEPEDATYGEHTCSLMTGSYAMWGGLNGSTGGTGNILTNLRKLNSDAPWVNAFESTILQNVFLANVARLEEQVGIDAFYEKYQEPGSEKADLKEALIAAKAARAELKKAYKEGAIVMASWLKMKEAELTALIQKWEDKEKLVGLDHIMKSTLR